MIYFTVSAYHKQVSQMGQINRISLFSWQMLELKVAKAECGNADF